MRLQAVRDACLAAPFRPFSFHMADGREVEVPAPDFVSVQPAGRTVLIWTREGGFRVLDMASITEISFRNGTT
jgi:hypothetical protein